MPRRARRDDESSAAEPTGLPDASLSADSDSLPSQAAEGATPASDLSEPVAKKRASTRRRKPATEDTPVDGAVADTPEAPPETDAAPKKRLRRTPKRAVVGEAEPSSAAIEEELPPTVIAEAGLAAVAAVSEPVIEAEIIEDDLSEEIPAEVPDILPEVVTAEIADVESEEHEIAASGFTEPIEVAEHEDDDFRPEPAVPEPITLAQAPSDPASAPSLRTRRRIGGRRTAAEAAQAVAALRGEPNPAPQPGAVPSGTTEDTPRRRGGRNRPKTPPPVVVTAVETLAPSDDILDVPLEDGTSTTEETAETRRSRRSRRGGRRRSGRAEGAEKTPPPALAVAAQAEEPEAEAIAVVVPEVEEPEEDVDFKTPVLRVPTVWTAPRLVPRISDLGLAPIETRVKARLDDSASHFVINDVDVAPFLFFVNAETGSSPEVVRDEIALAARAGVHIHSGVAYLPLKNAYGSRSFAATDALLEQVLAADPDAYVLLRLQCVPTNFWARTHPDEMAKFSDGTEGDVSFASKEFWADCVDAVSALIAHLSDPATPGGDRVIGFHLDKGEWFYDAKAGYDLSAPNRIQFQNWLHAKYQSVYGLRAAWYDGTVKFEDVQIPQWSNGTAKPKDGVVLHVIPHERRWVDYNAYASDIMAQAITGVAEAIKSLTGGRMLAGVSYGYTLEFAQRNDSGHQALGKILASPHIDLIAGPNTYQNRGAGGTGAFSSPIDSVRLHQKLWIVEDDTKTFLAADETEDSFNPKIASPQDTLSVQRRNISAGLLHRCGVCWMDVWGQGWLNAPEVWDELGRLRLQEDVTRRMTASAGRSQAPEVAVLIDEAGYAYVRGDALGSNLQAGLITKTRDLILRSGASVGFYLQSDVASLPEETRLVIFLNALRVTTEERQVIRERLQRPGKTLAWLYAPGLYDEKGESPAEVSEIVGMALKAQPWNSRIGTLFTEERHPVIERLHGGKRLGTEEVLNPSYTEADPQAVILGEYIQSGAPSIAAKVAEGGWRSVFIGEPHLTGELLRGLYRYAGVHLYDVQDDVVHASADGLLLIHAPYTGQRTIHLPKPGAVYSFYDQRLVTLNSSTFRSFMRGRTTHFFLFGELERIADALGTTPDALRDAHAAHRAEREAANQQRNAVPVQSDETQDDGGAEAEFAEAAQLATEPSAEQNHRETMAEVVLETLIVTDEAVEYTSLSAAGMISEVDQELLSADGDNPVPVVSLDSSFADELDATSEQPSVMSPSRRRRWQRKRSLQPAQTLAPGEVSIEEILPGLPPRRVVSEGPEENGSGMGDTGDEISRD